MQPAIVAFAFGVLLFFASSAALALEPPPQALGFGHLTLLLLAMLHAVTGFLVIAGPASLVERQWVPVAVCATASIAVSTVAVIAAMALADTVRLGVSPDGATLVLFLVLLGGVALLVQHAYNTFGPMPDPSSKKSRDE
jgi:hypothetical protein